MLTPTRTRTHAHTHHSYVCVCVSVCVCVCVCVCVHARTHTHTHTMGATVSHASICGSKHSTDCKLNLQAVIDYSGIITIIMAILQRPVQL